MADATPTEWAVTNFKAAASNFRNMSSTGALNSEILGLIQLAQGLESLTVGLRATYMKLEQIEKLIKNQRTNQPW